MNKQMRSKDHTYIVQAGKIIKTFPCGESNVKYIRPHYFLTIDDVERFLNMYIPIIKKDPEIINLYVASKQSVNTCLPFIIEWKRT